MVETVWTTEFFDRRFMKIRFRICCRVPWYLFQGFKVYNDHESSLMGLASPWHDTIDTIDRGLGTIRDRHFGILTTSVHKLGGWVHANLLKLILRMLISKDWNRLNIWMTEWLNLGKDSLASTCLLWNAVGQKVSQETGHQLCGGVGRQERSFWSSCTFEWDLRKSEDEKAWPARMITIYRSIEIICKSQI